MSAMICKGRRVSLIHSSGHLIAKEVTVDGEDAQHVQGKTYATNDQDEERFFDWSQIGETFNRLKED